jgi:RNA polymerase sporulation-specific sigma factor
MSIQGKVEICGVNTSKLKVLKNEETMELLRRVKQGDMDAREQLIAGNLRLVLSVIQKFMGRGENADDLFQVGCIGLIKAIDNFNIDLDVKFSTYGVPTNVTRRKHKPLFGCDCTYSKRCSVYRKHQNSRKHNFGLDLKIHS